MRIVVVGAGAVGCYAGALLTLAGYDVTLVARSAQCTVIQTCGLFLEMDGTTQCVRVRAVSDSEGMPAADLVLVCVKVGDSESAASVIQTLLHKDTIIVSMQNGIDSAKRLSELTGREVLPAALYIAVDMVKPGHVIHCGGQKVILGNGKGSELVASVLNRASPLQAGISEDMTSVLWGKLTINCIYNAFSAITLVPYSTFLKTEDTDTVMLMLLDECRSVATACGATLPDDMADQLRDIARLMPTQKSSAAQDVLRGRMTEIEFLNGYVVKKAREHNIAAPINLTLLVAVRLIEQRIKDDH